MIDSIKTWWMPALLGILAALLPLLAFLQYRWIGAVSDGEQARLRRTLQAGVHRFADDVDRPLEQVYEAFLLDDAPAPEGLARALTRRYRRWQTTTPAPVLLDAVYWIAVDTSRALRLHRLDTATVALVPETWTDDLAPWQAYFAEKAARTPSGTPPNDIAPEPPMPSEPPGLSMPLLPRLQPGSDPPASQPGYLLLLLNHIHITQTLFPALARTYFLDDHEATYDVLIHHRDEPGKVVYRSNATLTAADFAAPDAAADLGFSSRINLTTYVTDDGAGTKMTMERHDSARVRVDVEMTRETETILVEKEALEDVTRAPTPRGMPAAPDRPGTLIARSGRPVQPWRLLVRHKAGSIEAAIGTMRRRTLGLGFGILLVLGAAAAMLFVSARRARRLAEQQMAFVAGVTHELRTPLAVIRSAAENLADGVITDPEKARRYGTLIHNEGRRLSEIVEQALALAGAQSNHARLDLKPVAVGPLLEQALARCRPTLDEQDAALSSHLTDDLPPVHADAPALEAALCNLITNACKYGGPESRIELEARTDADRQTVHITVRDHGPGIPADELPHLFEPFYRGRAARQAQIRGSGLGLSLVKNTVEAHGGRISVDSAVGKGSAFTIHLPVDLTSVKREIADSR